MKRSLPFLIILSVLGIALGAAWYLKQNAVQPAPAAAPAASDPGSRAGTPPTAPASNPATAERGAEPPHSIGPANATVTLEEFGDFQCPPCSLFHPELKKIKAEFSGRIRIIFREFPLPTHEHATSAAKAAEAAGMQGRFWEMHDMLYENQRSWSKTFDVRQIFEGYAARIGLDMDKFKRDLTTVAVEQRILLDGKRAVSLGVKGTPTVFINGREVPFESLPAEKLRPIIDAELTRSGNK